MSDSNILPGGPRVERTRTGHGPGFASSVAFSAARGAGLIALAVIIGIVLLQVIDDGTSGPIGDGNAAASGGTTTTTAAAEPGASSTTSTTAGAPVKPPAEVAVLVLNGSGRPGAATAQSNTIEGQRLPNAAAGRRAGASGQHRLLQARARPRVHVGRDLGRRPTQGRGASEPGSDRERERQLRRHPRHVARPRRARRARVRWPSMPAGPRCSSTSTARSR